MLIVVQKTYAHWQLILWYLVRSTA